MLRSTFAVGIAALLLTGGMLVTASSSQEKADDVPGLLRRSAAFVDSQQHATLELSYHLKLQEGGKTKSADSFYRVLLGKEGQFALGSVQGTFGPRVHSDGESMVIVPPSEDAESVRFGIRHGIAAFASGRSSRLIGHGLGGLTLSLLSPIATNNLLQASSAPVYVGKETITVGDDKVACHHARMTSGDLTWDFWVESGDRPLLRRIVPDLSDTQGAQAAATEPQPSLVIDFDRWDLDSTIPAAAFWTAERPHVMLGKRPPAVTLPLLGGKGQRLQELIGKKVIVLDFWATWCPPCVASLPTLDEVTTEYADKGVVSFAINEGDEVAQLEDFLAQRDWKLPVVLDGQGEINRVLKAGDSLPTSMIIGLDGRVQVVAKGIPSAEGGYRKKLVEELDALLAKKDLAAKSLKEWAAMTKVFADEAAE